MIIRGIPALRKFIDFGLFDSSFNKNNHQPIVKEVAKKNLWRQVGEEMRNKEIFNKLVEGAEIEHCDKHEDCGPLEVDLKMVSEAMRKHFRRREAKWKKGREGDEKIEGELFGLAAMDFSQYFYNFAIAKSDQVIEVFNINAQGKAEAEYWQVAHCLFGALSSIQVAVLFSDMLGDLVCRLCRTLCFIYIDDSIILYRAGVRGATLRAIKALYGQIGLVLSDKDQYHKTPEDDGHLEDDSLVVLGVQCRRVPNEQTMTFIASQDRMEKAKLAGEKVLEEITFKNLEVFVGKVVSCVYLSDYRDRYDVACLGYQYMERVKAGKTIDEREFNNWVELATKACFEVAPAVSSRRMVNAPVMLIYSDASAEEGYYPRLGFLARHANGKFSCRGMKVISKQLGIKNKKFHIGVWELLGIYDALERLQAQLKGVRILFFGDNMGAMFNILKGNSSCKICRGLVLKIWRLCRSAQLWVRWSWVSTVRNGADGPSREYYGLCRKLRAKKLNEAHKDFEDTKRYLELMSDAVKY